MKKQLAILISGNGGLMRRAIIEQQRPDAAYDVKLVVGSSAECPGLLIAKQYGVKTMVVDFSKRETWKEQSENLWKLLEQEKIDFVMLLGWLKKLTVSPQWQKRVFNIHPSLLPAYGGKGMIGYAVHQAVIADKAPFSGFTCHEVNDKYDDGNILYQYQCPVNTDDTAKTLQDRVINLQHDKLFEIIQNLTNYVR